MKTWKIYDAKQKNSPSKIQYVIYARSDDTFKDKPKENH